MSRPYLQHGRRHAPGGSDPIPGLAPGLPAAALRKVNTFTWTPSLTTPRSISWDKFATTDPTVYTISGGAVTIEEAGFYISVVSVIPDGDWPTSPTGPIKIGSWGGDSNEPAGIAPYGQYPGVDVFANPGGDTLALTSFTVLQFSSPGTWFGGGMNFSGSDWSGSAADAWIWRVNDYLVPA